MILILKGPNGRDLALGREDTGELAGLRQEISSPKYHLLHKDPE